MVIHQQLLLSSSLIFFIVKDTVPHRPRIHDDHCSRIVSVLNLKSKLCPEPGMLWRSTATPVGCFFVAPRLLGRELPKKARRSELDSFGECCAPKGRRVGTISLRRERNIHIYIYIYIYYRYIYIQKYTLCAIYPVYSHFTHFLRTFWALFTYFAHFTQFRHFVHCSHTLRTLLCALYAYVPWLRRIVPWLRRSCSLTPTFLFSDSCSLTRSCVPWHRLRCWHG